MERPTLIRKREEGELQPALSTTLSLPKFTRCAAVVWSWRTSLVTSLPLFGRCEKKQGRMTTTIGKASPISQTMRTHAGREKLVNLDTSQFFAGLISCPNLLLLEEAEQMPSGILLLVQ